MLQISPVLRLTAHFFFRFRFPSPLSHFLISLFPFLHLFHLLVSYSSCYLLLHSSPWSFSDLDCIILWNLLFRFFFFKIITRVLYDWCHVTNESRK